MLFFESKTLISFTFPFSHAFKSWLSISNVEGLEDVKFFPTSTKSGDGCLISWFVLWVSSLVFKFELFVWLIGICLIGSSNDNWSVGWFIDRFVGWFICWLRGWIVGWFIGWIAGRIGIGFGLGVGVASLFLFFWVRSSKRSPSLY